LVLGYEVMALYPPIFNPNKRLLGHFATSHPLPLGVPVKVDVETYISLGITEKVDHWYAPLDKRRRENMLLVHILKFI
jgi:hypothetical protein